MQGGQGSDANVSPENERREKASVAEPPRAEALGTGANVEMLTDWLLGVGVGGGERWAGCWRAGGNTWADSPASILGTSPRAESQGSRLWP